MIIFWRPCIMFMVLISIKMTLKYIYIYIYLCMCVCIYLCEYLFVYYLSIVFRKIKPVSLNDENVSSLIICGSLEWRKEKATVL